MRGIIDALYWKIHSAFLLNQRGKAILFLDMLEDEIGPFGDAASEIGPVHAARLRRISEEIRSGNFGRLHGGSSVPEGSFMPKGEPSGEEMAFHAVLMTKQARTNLFPLLGLSPSAGMLHEYDLGEYGRVDFLVRNGRRIAVLEVKMGQAPRSVSPQVEGYRTCLELEMCRGLHDEVVAAVLAESFPPVVAAELSRMGIRMVLHENSPDRFREFLPGN